MIGAVLVPGAKAPSLVVKGDLKAMRPGSVIVDVAVDQGGCVETIRPTTHDDPIYSVHGVIHYGVANMPGGVPQDEHARPHQRHAPLCAGLGLEGLAGGLPGRPPAFAGSEHRERTRDLPRRRERLRTDVFGRAGLPPFGSPGVRLLRHQVRFRRLPNNPDLPLPSPATQQAAGYDVRSAEDDFMLQPKEIRLVSTGLTVQLPPGLECQVRPRSGLALRHGITLPNSPGTIDPDYRGEVRIIMQNHGAEPVRIERGERIAQLVFQHFSMPEIVETEDLTDTARGSDGFGSTGRK